MITTDLKIETTRLILRNYRTEDWGQVHIYGSDPDFSKYELWGPNTLEDTHKFINDMIEKSKAVPRTNYDFAVTKLESDLLIGGAGIRLEAQESSVASLGWAITPQMQNQGFATEAAQALITFGFQQLGLKVIYATCDVRNAASYRVMEKLGMKRVGLLKGTKEVKGHVRDSYRYEILAT